MLLDDGSCCFSKICGKRELKFGKALSSPTEVRDDWDGLCFADRMQVRYFFINT